MVVTYVGCGPSGNTCPKCAPDLASITCADMGRGAHSRQELISHGTCRVWWQQARVSHKCVCQGEGFKIPVMPGGGLGSSGSHETEP